MPIYEYKCLDCGKKFSQFLRRISGDENIRCTFCSSSNAERIMSRFNSIKSEEDRMEKLADPSKWSGLDESDPKSVANFVRKMGNEMGEEISKDEIDQMADEAARESESGFGGEGEGGDASSLEPEI